MPADGGERHHAREISIAARGAVQSFARRCHYHLHRGRRHRRGRCPIIDQMRIYMHEARDGRPGEIVDHRSLLHIVVTIDADICGIGDALMETEGIFVTNDAAFMAAILFD